MSKDIADDISLQARKNLKAFIDRAPSVAGEPPIPSPQPIDNEELYRVSAGTQGTPPSSIDRENLAKSIGFEPIINISRIHHAYQHPETMEWLLNETLDAITSYVTRARIDPFDYVESCEPDCSPERHAYHQGQWDMARRICRHFGAGEYPGGMDELLKEEKD